MSGQDVADACLAIESAARLLAADLPALRKRLPATDAIGHHLLDRAAVAVEFAAGSALLGHARLAAPAAAVTRSLMDSFIGSYWACLDDERGRILADAPGNELKRIMRLNLKAGNAAIVDRQTGQVRTGKLLSDPGMATATRFPRTNDMAKDCGIGRIYEMIYGMLSLRSHAAAITSPRPERPDDEIAGHLHAAAAITKCLHLVLNNRIREMRVTARQEVASILKVDL